MAQHICTNENGIIELKRKRGRPRKTESLPESTLQLRAQLQQQVPKSMKNCLLKSSCSTAAGCSGNAKSKAFVLARRERRAHHFDE